MPSETNQSVSFVIGAWRVEGALCPCNAKRKGEAVKTNEEVFADIREILRGFTCLTDSEYAGYDVQDAWYQADDLWAVLSALRGPDNGDWKLKVATTAVIRHKLGLEKSNGQFVVMEDTELAVDYRKNLGDDNSHFVSHAQRAFKALGLKWDALNTKEQS